jgi:hypothetical protein
MDAAILERDFDHLKSEGWIPCFEKLPPNSQFVLYRTPKYTALGKIEEQTWYYSGDSLELEHGPVVCWQPLN